MENSGSFIFIFILYLALIGYGIVGYWKLFEKAGKPGWASIIPFYNIVVWFEITGRPVWHIILLFIPFVNFIILILAIIDLCKSFGKTNSVDYILAIFFGIIYLPYLGFASDVKYVGPVKGGSLAAPAV